MAIGKRVSVFIHYDNLDKWNELENKSGYINDVLSGAEQDFERKVRRELKEILPSVLQELQGF